MLLFIFNMYETTFSFLGCILKFRFLNLYIIIIVTKIKGLLKEKRKGNGGVDKKICRANFQQRSFLATFAMDVFLIRCSLWDITFFQIIGSGDVISWIIDEILTFWGKFSYLLNRLSSEVVRPLFLIRKQLTCGYFISVHHFENRKWLKIAIFG